MRRFEYIRARSVEEAVGLLPADRPSPVQAKGSGIDLLLLMKNNVASFDRLIDLSGIDDLKKIEANPEGIKLGALVTLAQIAKHPEIQKNYRALAQASAEAATPQIRNRATIGGNLCQRPQCWYFRSADFPCLKKGGTECYALDGENRYHALFGYERCAAVHPSNLATALAALDAKIHLKGHQEERSVPAEAFFEVSPQEVTTENILRPGELITGVEIPSDWKSAYLEVGDKRSFDWALVTVGVAAKTSGGRIADIRIFCGAVAPRPWRVLEAEKTLQGTYAHDTERFKEAAETAVRAARPLAHNGYKVPILKALLPRAVQAALA
jgi:xanthine dehydrogenase YagS FAD-binding subunit